MANRNSAGWGLRPAGTLGNTPATQGLSQYWIDAGYSTSDLFHGQAMKSSGGYLITGESATTVTTVGVLFGIYYNAATTLKPTWAHWYDATITPANSEDTQAFVNDYPFQKYTIASDDAVAASIAAAHVKFMETFSVYANTGGNTTTGNSTATLDIAATNATTHSWRLLRSAEDPENNDLTAAYCTLEVVQNLSEFVGTGT
tara:strand:+ start:102 stop:704 length:603 start_codon:yes stop_codon:yes gene_type:complete